MNAITRVPKGVPAGGQFAEGLRNETDASLLDADGEQADAGQPLTLEHLPLAERALSARLRRYQVTSHENINGLSGEDIAQNARTEVLALISRGTRARDPRSYISQVVSNQFEQAFRRGMSRSVRKANQILSARTSEEENRLGRSLTVAERKALCADIYANWQGSNRPPRDFFEHHQQFYYSAEIDEAYMSGTTVESAEDAAFDRLDGDIQRAGEDDAEAAAIYARYQQMGNKQAVQIEAADLILERNDAPAIVEGSLSRRQRDKAVKAMREHPGGVSAAIEDYYNGRDSPATAALFAAWNDRELSARDEDAILKAFTHAKGDFKQELWLSSIAKADNRAAKARQSYTSPTSRSA